MARLYFDSVNQPATAVKEALLQMARYNAWANARIITALQATDDATLDAGQASSFPSLRRTAYHIWSAESIWVERLQLAENPAWAEKAFTGTFAEATALWKQASAGLVLFTEKQWADRAFEHVVEYRTMKREMAKTAVGDILRHVFNHSAFHRGQVVTLMRGAGISVVPPTDLIVYLRTGGK